MYIGRDSHVARALTIAGSDSGGGAGIQADLKTFAAFDVYGMSAIAGLTAQNTVGVQGVQYVDPDFVKLQLSSVLDDLGCDAVKTGMLGSSAIIETVASMLKNKGVSNLVVDPVMIAKGGESLLDEDAVHTIQQSLLPLATVLTPNIPEAEVLCGYRIQSFADCHKAAQDLSAMGARTVVIKGGHAQEQWLKDAPWPELETAGSAADVVFDGKDFSYFVTPRVQSRKTHGTGCTFSSAIAASLARGIPPLGAIAVAKSFIYEAILGAKDWDVGALHGPTDHSQRPKWSAVVETKGAYRWESNAWQLQKGRRG